MAIKIMLVDDHAVVLNGLKFFLATQTDFDVLGTAKNGKEAVEKANELNPDVILMDLMMPIMDGIEATRQIKQNKTEIKIIVLTTFSDQDHVLPAIKAGANGYLLKDAQPEDISDAIRKVNLGEALLHPKVTEQLMQLVVNTPEIKKKDAEGKQSSLEPLTAREREVLLLIGHGKSNKEIASELYISEKTVKTHVSNILSKLECADRTQAAIYAIREGFVQ